jgi:transcription initiation factor TFIIB
VDGLRRIADMADRLGLVATARDQAKETFEKLMKQAARGFPASRHRDAVCAACLSIACHDLGMPRTYKELTSVTADRAAARKDIGKMTAHIRKIRGEVMDIGVVRASHTPTVRGFLILLQHAIFICL